MLDPRMNKMSPEQQSRMLFIKLNQKTQAYRTLMIAFISTVVILLLLFTAYLVTRNEIPYDATDKLTIERLKKQVHTLKHALNNIPELKCEEREVKVKIKTINRPFTACSD